MSERRGVVVLGMHRSGTSATTRLVSLLGLPLAPDDDQIPVDRNNPTGYWESLSLMRWNEQILAALDGDPWCAPVLPRGWEDDPRLDHLRRPAAEAFDQVFPGPQWVWKDPRNCLTLPFWRQVTGADPVALLVVRNPLEIARSLAVRDGYSTAHTLALWERYTRAAVASAAGRPARLTTYEQVLADPLRWCAETAAFLREHGIAAEEPAPDAVATFVDPGLRHSAFDASALDEDPAVSDEQRALYRALADAAGDHPALDQALPPETPWVAPLLEERRLAGLAERGRAVAPTLSDIVGEPVRRVVTIAKAAELETSPSLLAEYTRRFRADDDATLVVLATDAAAGAAAVMQAAEQSGADIETGPDILLATPPAGTETLIARGAHGHLVERAVADGPFANVPRMDARRLGELANRARAA